MNYDNADLALIEIDSGATKRELDLVRLIRDARKALRRCEISLATERSREWSPSDDEDYYNDE